MAHIDKVSYQSGLTLVVKLWPACTPKHLLNVEH